MRATRAWSRAALGTSTGSPTIRLPNSRVRQADYYPRGCSTILDIMIGKTLRMQSLLEAYEEDPSHDPNFESLEDSAIDLINYSAFFAAYLTGDIDGQSPERDFLNRGVEKDGST